MPDLITDILELPLDILDIPFELFGGGDVTTYSSAAPPTMISNFKEQISRPFFVLVYFCAVSLLFIAAMATLVLFISYMPGKYASFSLWCLSFHWVFDKGSASVLTDVGISDRSLV